MNCSRTDLVSGKRHNTFRCFFSLVAPSSCFLVPHARAKFASDNTHVSIHPQASPSWLAAGSGWRKSAHIIATHPALPLYTWFSLSKAIAPVKATLVVTPICIAYS
ncbi:hypothetical protein RRG08_009273 [Elysia crispata]|uniref:Uncharacterized protein n=1 Tax=Elysia crispata TaxID=231223 RepID=A0AAE0ZR84_9GAST|nr:hypothetical protein RRG08_009273 [Elysia crispata]